MMLLQSTASSGRHQHAQWSWNVLLGLRQRILARSKSSRYRV